MQEQVQIELAKYFKDRHRDLLAELKTSKQESIGYANDLYNLRNQYDIKVQESEILRQENENLRKEIKRLRVENATSNVRLKELLNRRPSSEYIESSSTGAIRKGSKILVNKKVQVDSHICYKYQGIIGDETTNRYDAQNETNFMSNHSLMATRNNLHFSRDSKESNLDSKLIDKAKLEYQTKRPHSYTVSTPEKRPRCDFDNCGKTFSRKDHLTRHQKSVHSNERPYVCETCHESFKLYEYLRRHKIKLHSLNT